MSVSQRGIDRLDYVPVAVFRERFLLLQERHGFTLADLARAMGEKNERRGTIGRVIGLRPESDARRRDGGRDVYRKYVRYETAVRLAEALGMDPFEAGI